MKITIRYCGEVWEINISGHSNYSKNIKPFINWLAILASEASNKFASVGSASLSRDARKTADDFFKELERRNYYKEVKDDETK